MRFRITFIFLSVVLLTSVFLPVNADPISTRTISFVNQCDFPVWFGFAGGSADNIHTKKTRACTSNQDCYAGSVCKEDPVDHSKKICDWVQRTVCLSDQDCFTGTRCIQTNEIKQCFWINPIPSNGNYQLAMKGGKNQVTIPVYETDNEGLIWSGAAAGRTGCSNSSCETASCGGTNNGACAPSRGFDQPATQAEFTFNRLPEKPDFYDVEIINGVSISMKMSADTTISNPQNPYFCTTPGSEQKQNMLGQCSWTFTPPSNDYQWVKAGGSSCQANSECQSPETCGLSFNPGKNPLLQKTCGKLLGYWTADQVCGYNPKQGAPFDCESSYSLYACIGNNAASCYHDNAPGNCCGCANWDTLGVVVPPAPFTKLCVNTNPFWNSKSQPQLLWLKQGCPTVYTYPYDDMSSTFTCKSVQNNMNSVNYRITFCPEK